MLKYHQSEDESGIYTNVYPSAGVPHGTPHDHHQGTSALAWGDRAGQGIEAQTTR